MSAFSVNPTFPIFTDIDGQPLENGYIYVGASNLDPQTNPINVYWDAALTQLAVQPIRTRGGYPVNSGTPARLYVNSDYSIRVMNKNGSTIYSAPAATERVSDAIISGIDASKVTYTPAGTGAVATTVQSKLRESVSVKDFGAKGDGTADDTAAIQAALNASNNVYMPTGNYRITATITMPNGSSLWGDPVTGPVFFPNDKFGTYISVDTTETAIRFANTHCSLSNLAIYYPNQVRTGTPVVHDYAIKAGISTAETLNSTIDSVVLINAYNGVYVYGGRVTVSNVKGTIANIGLYQAYSGDCSNFTNIHFNTINNWTTGGVWEWTLQNSSACGFVVGELDGATPRANDASHYTSCNAIGFYCGFYITHNNSGTFTSCTADVSTKPFILNGAFNFSINQCTLTTGTRPRNYFASGVVGITIGTGSRQSYDVAINNCVITNCQDAAIYIVSVKNLSITGNIFSSNKNHIIESAAGGSGSANGITVSGNVFDFGASSKNAIQASYIGQAVFSNNVFSNNGGYTSIGCFYGTFDNCVENGNVYRNVTQVFESTVNMSTQKKNEKVTAIVRQASGTAGTYGTAYAISAPAGYSYVIPRAAYIVCDALTAASTFTMRIRAVYRNGTTVDFEKAFTAAGNYTLLATDLDDFLNVNLTEPITRIELASKSTTAGISTESGRFWVWWENT